MCESSSYSCNLDVKRPKSERGGVKWDWTSNPNLRNAYGQSQNEFQALHTLNKGSLIMWDWGGLSKVNRPQRGCGGHSLSRYFTSHIQHHRFQEGTTNRQDHLQPPWQAVMHKRYNTCFVTCPSPWCPHLAALLLPQSWHRASLPLFVSCLKLSGNPGKEGSARWTTRSQTQKTCAPAWSKVANISTAGTFNVNKLTVQPSGKVWHCLPHLHSVKESSNIKLEVMYTLVRVHTHTRTQCSQV